MLLLALLSTLACSLDTRALHLAGATGDGANAGGRANSDPTDEASAASADSDGNDGGAGNEPDSPTDEASSERSCDGAPGAMRCTVAGGSFRIDPQGAAVPAEISSFQLDQGEVTVGRFRAYVADFAGPPQAGAGAHPQIAHSGWRDEWNALLPESRAQLIQSLHCNADWETWTDDPGAREDYPLTCVSYYLAFAFCAWSGGRLPTEAEWEYAASGGAQQRAYPWGNQAPTFERAVFATTAIAASGERRAGMARFGHLDLAGSAWEWTLDAHRPYPRDCADCAEVERGSERVLRGGAFLSDAEALSASSRFHLDPQLALGDVGFRCAWAAPP